VELSCGVTDLVQLDGGGTTCTPAPPGFEGHGVLVNEYRGHGPTGG
jgi:hypothetical protein